MFFHCTLVYFCISLPAKLWEPSICLCSQSRVSELWVHRYLFLLDSVLSPDSSINFTLCLPGLVQAPSFSSCSHWQILWNGRDAVSPKMLSSLWWRIHYRDGQLCVCCTTLQITSVSQHPFLQTARTFHLPAIIVIHCSTMKDIWSVFLNYDYIKFIVLYYSSRNHNK